MNAIKVMIDQFKYHLKNTLQLKPMHKVLLAVSGGKDSIVMLDLFKQMPFEFSIAHCNFQLRGDESDGDEKFVVSIAKKAGIKIFTKKFQTEKFAKQNQMSTQMAARELRYEWFEELSEKNGFDFIATGHHQTDLTETILINQIRGTGLSGIHGIRPVQGKIIRPLLFATQEELNSYAIEKKLKWREDSSNAKDDYVRNKIRQRILPVLRELNPSIEKTFSENALHFHDAELLLDEFIQKVKNQIFKYDHNGITVSISEINRFQNPSALLFYLLRAFGFKNEISQSIFESLTRTSGKKFLSETHQLIKNRDELIITKLNYESAIQHEHYEILEDDDGLIGQGFSIKIKRITLSKTKKADFIKSPAVAYFDAEKIHFPLQLRKWKKGDYFHPFGMKGKRKKVSDFFIDEKISMPEKEHIWLMLTNNEICWLAGRRSDERFKVTSQTKIMLQLTYTETN